MLAIGDDELTAALDRVTRGKPNARERVLLEPLLTEVFQRLRDFVARYPKLSIGYSVKTNPQPEYLREALRCGFYAETISGGEVQQALKHGFTAQQVVYNGPIPASRLHVMPKYVFADSVESFAANARALGDSIVGVRLRPPRIHSHFGVPPTRVDELIAAVRGSGRPEIGVSFQIREEDYGAYDLRRLVDVVTETAQRIERESGARIVAFDAGGGHSPQSFDKHAKDDDFGYMCSHVSDRLTSVREFLIEPGQELDLSLQAMIAPVLEARSTAEGPEIVVDAGHPDFPYLQQAPHRFFLRRNDTLEQLDGGPGRIIGRSCLEYDVIAQNVRLPTDVGTQDAIVIADIGAYDASTQYAFAMGFISGNTAL
jgi:diaminopimelate decarboxylase